MPQQVPQQVIDDFNALIANLITEDDEPVDNWFSEKQQRLLVEPLQSSWRPIDEETGETRKFIAAANVGVFDTPKQPAIVPDAFISLDVTFPDNPDFDELRSYFVWDFEEPPSVVVEVVSNTKGSEMQSKMLRYRKMHVPYYIVFDPFGEVNPDKLRVYQLTLEGRRYALRQDFDLPEVGLSVKLWRGVFEGVEDEWLRWCDADGNLIPSGIERAEQEKQRAEAEAQRADDESKRADDESKRADDESKRADDAEAELVRLRAELARLQK